MRVPWRSWYGSRPLPRPRRRKRKDTRSNGACGWKSVRGLLPGCQGALRAFVVIWSSGQGQEPVERDRGHAFFRCHVACGGWSGKCEGGCRVMRHPLVHVGCGGVAYWLTVSGSSQPCGGLPRLPVAKWVVAGNGQTLRAVRHSPRWKEARARLNCFRAVVARRCWRTSGICPWWRDRFERVFLQ